MRTFAGPGMLAVRGRIRGPARVVVLLAATGELAMDKTSKATDRTDLPAVLGRVAAGAYAGRDVAGAAGAVTASVTAAVGSYAGWRARGLVVEATGLPDPVVAVGEDILALAIAAIGTRPDPGEGTRPDPGQVARPVPGQVADPAPSADGADAPEAAGPGSVPPETSAPRRASLLRHAGIGLVAGLAGTAAMTIAQGAEFVLTDAEPSSAPADIADKLQRRAGQGRLRRGHRRAANQGMHWLYGTSWGIPYGIVAASSGIPPELSGPVFGLLVWGAGLAHQPVLGIADPPWKRSPASLGSEALFHLVYGIGAGAAVRAQLSPAPR
jgi:hypothetical protein